MTRLLLTFAAGFASVFLLGFQSRNVNAGHYGWAAGTSTAIAVAQGCIWTQIARDGSWPQVAAYALAAPLAIVASMAAHARFIDRRGSRS